MGWLLMFDEDYEAICEELRSNGLEDTLLKYNCSLNELFNYCLHRNFLTEKNKVKKESKKKSNPLKYIQKHSDGRYRVRKSVGGKLIYFGYYDTVNDAIRVRDKLVEVGWKKYLLDEVCKDLGIDYR